MKKAFTIVELLVVIGIIGILVASLVAVMGDTNESGRAAKCRSNLRQLAQACYSIAMADDANENLFPMAGSCEAQGKFSELYSERKGWISWLSQGKYPGVNKNHPRTAGSHQNCPMAGVFCTPSEIQFAYTNGALWRAIDGNADVFKCPTMLRDERAKREGRSMGWCYVMSARFHYDTSRGSDTTESPKSGVRPTDIKKPSKTLMFAEMCLDDIGSGGRNDYMADSVLEYGVDDMKKERIGFPHKIKKDYAGFVAFVDGHVESVIKPRTGTSREQEMTRWLCQGHDITYDPESGDYSKIEDTVGDGDSDDSDD